MRSTFKDKAPRLPSLFYINFPKNNLAFFADGKLRKTQDSVPQSF